MSIPGQLNPSPRVLAANLLDKNGQFQDMVRPWETSGKENAGQVGVVALVGPSVSGKVKDDSIKFVRDNGIVLKKAVGDLSAKKVALIVLLYQGTLKEAKACAEFWATLAVGAAAAGCRCRACAVARSARAFCSATCLRSASMSPCWVATSCRYSALTVASFS